MNIDILRRLENLIRPGVIFEIDHDKALCIVDFQGIKTCPLPWLTLRAGTDSTWDAPTKGEQCIVFAASGELTNGFVLVGLYSNDSPAPSNNPNIKMRKFSDGAVIQYDAENHHLQAILPVDGTATITAPGGITLNGDTTINGNVLTNGSVAMTGNNTVGGSQLVQGSSHSSGHFSTEADVTAGDISLKHHLTANVKSGSDISGEPVP
ncbi:phage baseplate assembly protein V [Acinetobacter qingfengensis]|uniref:Baseplate assembly protein n=1 Tax=Acinetobacter qingfengensis TaxID=1262585 RepID=A0A1E7RCA7_9GAMM|nr:phage baseplate assembly protein V [Acinetobacter qingfengensis]KAA8734916.1 phage baseplate assembly protein V [Acinetobacter qingfengensis]OEY96916.1 baseplate assembly protein [Acinetobacter qingfengensis]